MLTDLSPGQANPLGATVMREGVNFSVMSRYCTSLELLLFDRAEDSTPSRIIQLDPKRNRTFYYWHIFVKGVQNGQLYGYRAIGPYRPEKGLRFDGDKLLIDPYARSVMYGSNYQREAAIHPGDNCGQAMKSVVVDARGFNWEGDCPIHLPFARSILYELHVGGFTRHPSSGVASALRGTYAGLVEKIPYLKELGITSVELLPVQQFDEQDIKAPLTNYWGYNPVVFFAPHRQYSANQDPLGPVNEFREMVKALHRAGIEVILDVVFNHTAEGDEKGPTLSFRGLENRTYYILETANPARYADFTGCGNSVNANNSIVRRMITDCLRYWVTGMHVDGFRFDLASVLSRDQQGQPLNDPPILWEIESDPVLAGTKIIAEAWDAAGLYQVGSFIGHRWAEWNGQYRDDIRRFVKGDSDSVVRAAARISGSRDLYPQSDREPNRSINFVTCHDGFTLNDLVSYNQKHNEANLLNNRDGTEVNFSWNCGAEGPSHDPEVEALRERQIRNFLTILMVSQGTPMLLMGDEIRRTQSGNNNAFCQDNEISWLNWEELTKNQLLVRFMSDIIRFRKRHSVFHEESFWTEPGGPEVIWHGVLLNQPDWGSESHSLAMELTYPELKEHIYIAMNPYWEPLTFNLPKPEHRGYWHRVVDTSLPPPQEYFDPPVDLEKQATYLVRPRSLIVLKEMHTRQSPAPATGGG